jgi:hypothetical protein
MCAFVSTPSRLPPRPFPIELLLFAPSSIPALPRLQRASSKAVAARYAAAAVRDALPSLFFVTSCAGSGSADVVSVAASFLCSRGLSLLHALRLLRQSIVIQTPPPDVLDIIYVAFQSQ